MRLYTGSNIIKCWQDYSGKKTQSSNISFCFFQVDLEPEGKVFVVITLTGSFTEGKGVALACFHPELGSALCPCHQLQSRADVWLLQGATCCGVPEVSWVMGEIWEGLLVTAGAVCALCSALRPGEPGPAHSGSFPWSCPSDRLFLSLLLFTWLPVEGQAEEKAEHVWNGVCLKHLDDFYAIMFHVYFTSFSPSWVHFAQEACEFLVWQLPQKKVSRQPFFFGNYVLWCDGFDIPVVYCDTSYECGCELCCSKPGNLYICNQRTGRVPRCAGEDWRNFLQGWKGC